MASMHQCSSLCELTSEVWEGHFDLVKVEGETEIQTKIVRIRFL